MNHELTEEQRILKDVIHKFAETQLRPEGAELDKNPEPNDRVPRSSLAVALSSLKIGAAFVPVEYGGTGHGIQELAIMAEELAWGDLGFVYLSMGNMHSAPPIIRHGNEAQKSQWLRAMAGNDRPGILVAAALTEPDTGANIFSPDPKHGIRTTAVLDNNEYVLNGRKCFINNAGLADLYLVWARTNLEKGAYDGGISVFLVPADTPGLKIGRMEDMMGIRTSRQAEVILEDCRVPRENLLGEEGQGIQQALDTLPQVLTLMGAASVGVARAAYETANSYAASRLSEGKPIKEYQAVNHKLIDMAIQIEAARALVWKSACLNDHNGPDYKLAFMSKIFGSEMAVHVTGEAVRLMGAYGYSREYPVEKYMRDAMSLQANGPNAVSRNHLAMFI